MNDPKAQTNQDEFERLLSLATLDVDYSEVNKKLDDLTKLASHITGTPISLVNLLEADTQWTVSSHGLDLQQMSREDSVCQHVIQSNDPVEIGDMTADDRFKDKSYVANSPGIHFYYGIPLANGKGSKIGALCVMDTKPTSLTKKQKELLQIIAEQVMDCIRNHHEMKKLQEAVDNLKLIQQKVTHDIRGPIGGIIGIAEVMESEMEEPEYEEYRHFLKLIKNGGQSLLEMSDDILSGDYTMSGNSEEGQFKTTLKDLRSKLLALYKPQALVKSISMTIETTGEYRDRLFPKHKLLQIFGNLITNAIKFTPENGQIDILLELIETTETYLKFVITDNGKGMDTSRINEILSGKPISNAGTKNERGFGFGFQLARHLTDSLNGDLLVESEPNRGTSITVQIPTLF